MCQEMSFSIILATAVSSMPTNDLAEGALRGFTQCRWIGHTTLQWKGGTLPLNYRRPSEILVANA